MGDVERVLDLLGVFTFAVTGGLVATRHGFDVVGVVVLAAVTGFGGGVVRDVLIGDIPPVALRDGWYPVAVMAAAVAVYFGARVVEIDGPRRALLLFDALGLGLFAATGTVKSLEAGLTNHGAVVAGVLTAVGGGVLRDTLAGEPPVVFRADRTLYAIPATAGAVTAVALTEAGANGVVVLTSGAATAIALRLAALRWNWTAPRPRHDGAF